MLIHATTTNSRPLTSTRQSPPTTMEMTWQSSPRLYASPLLSQEKAYH